MEVVPSVLLVGEAPVWSEPVSAALAVAGLRSRGARTAEEAVAQAAAHDYDVAVLSTAVAVGRIAALIEQLKQVRPGMACIVVTSERSREDALHALSAGAMAYLAFPLDTEALVELIKERRRHDLSPTAAALQLRVEERDGQPQLTLDGDLDLVTAPLLQRRVDELLGAGHDRMLIDADELDFCDSTGLRLLVSAQRRLTARGGALVLLRVSGILRRLLQISGLEATLLTAGGGSETGPAPAH
jgi:anti-sigma B factor antagonist